MVRSPARILIAVLLGALAGAICVVVAFTVRPAFVLDMDRQLPRRVASGFYPPERADDLTFVWTSRAAEVRLPGFDRRKPWTCVLRFRGGGPELHRTMIDVAADGITLVRARATPDFQDLQVTIPPRDRSGLTLGVTSSATFVPGPGDKRELGVQVDRLACEPANAGLILPPGPAIRAAAMAAAVFGAALGLANISLLSIGCAVLLLSVGEAILLATGVASYSDFPDTMLSFGVWIALMAVVLSKVLEAWSGQRLPASMTPTRNSGSAARSACAGASAGSPVRPNTPEPIHNVAATTTRNARMRL